MFKRSEAARKAFAKENLTPAKFQQICAYTPQDPIFLSNPLVQVPVFTATEPSLWKLPLVYGNTIIEEIKNRAPIPNLCVANLANAYYPGGLLYKGIIARAWEEALGMGSSFLFQQPLDYAPWSTSDKSPLDNMPGSSYRTENCRLLDLESASTQAGPGLNFTVITLAAPDFSDGHQLQAGYEASIRAAAKDYNEHPLKYIQEMTLKTHAQYQHTLEVGSQHLLTGPLGCGVFCNSPYILALIYAAVLQHPNYRDLQVDVVALGGNNFVFKKVFEQIQLGKLSDDCQKIIQIAMGQQVEFPQDTKLDHLVQSVEQFFEVRKATLPIENRLYSVNQSRAAPSNAMTFHQQINNSDETQALLPREKDHGCCVLQ